MDGLQREREDLIAADRHLAAGEHRIAEQIALIQWMNQRGYNTNVAEDLLQSLEQTLMTWREHRKLILAAIARHELLLNQGRKGSAPGSEAS